MKRAIKNHAGDFSAIIVLLVLAVVVTGYVLSHQGLRFPLVQSSPITDYVVMQTGQAITPGQGQTVRVSGVQVGTIGNIELQDGRARVALDILPQYKNMIRTNATALLRPRTGLDDMFIELNPGSKAAPVAHQGFTIPMGNSLPDVTPDEVLSELDADSRAYLDQLVTGAGLGLKNRGDELAQVFERFEPTHRDLARVNQAVAVRGRDLQQLVNSLARLNSALATKTQQITQLIDSSETVFHAFASEDNNVSHAVALLPGTLQQTTVTLEKVQAFAQQLGPAAQSLLPAARALPAANAALKALAIPSTPILKNQIRPFVIAARPVIRSLRPAAVNLAKATPNLATSFRVVNDFVNMLGYNPGDKMHGYLWWMAWVDHNARSLFSSQDANGNFRNLFLQTSCASAAQILNQSPLQSVIMNLTPILTSTSLCPKQAAAATAAYSLAKQGKLPKWAQNTNMSGAKALLSKLPTN
ncbi:MAG TPA: MlaD family protein [Solirubrobacteraceae bacterium]|jgi:phospholipid/cholesterol/gamma-HCH transport system substrate-binding protein|nr:MlaD family protein [Solirubrobacteraceae bacterium]